jgi:hypothetical protein
MYSKHNDVKHSKNVGVCSNTPFYSLTFLSFFNQRKKAAAFFDFQIFGLFA